jgi:8-oxo-dGTP diphosphatase
MPDMPSKRQITVAAAIIWKDGKVLITKRPEGTHLAGLWEFPGGKKEEAETLEECIAREIKEELGVEVDPGRLLLAVSHEYETKIVDLNIFECTLIDGSPFPMEGQEINWVRPCDMSDYAFPPPDIEVIEFLCRNRNDSF